MKSIFKSKTFWVNVLTAVAQYAGVLPIPAEVLPYVLAGINIVLRFITLEPVSLTGAV